MSCTCAGEDTDNHDALCVITLGRVARAAQTQGAFSWQASGRAVAEYVARTLDVTGLRSQLATVTRERDAAVREADRWRHNETIESDYVCPADLRADAAERDRDEARGRVEELLSECAAATDERNAAQSEVARLRTKEPIG